MLRLASFLWLVATSLSLSIAGASRPVPPGARFRWASGPGESLAVVTSGPANATGDAPVALLLPGPIGSAYSWRHVEAELVARGHRVWIVDPLGMGASSRPRGADYALSAQADRLRTLLDRVLGAATPVVVAGLGTSATIAMHLAATDTGRVAGVLSLAGGPVDRQGTSTVRVALALAPLLQTRMGIAMGRRRFTAAVREQSHDPGWFTPEIAAEYLRPLERDVRGQLTVLKDMHDAREPHPIATRLPHIVAPMRLLLGDTPTRNAPTSEQVALLMQHVRRISVDTIRQAGTLMHEERPAEIVRVLDEMLRRSRRVRGAADVNQLELDLDR